MHDFPTLDSLLLTEDELSTAREQVREMAYYKWLNAGSPDNTSMANWTAAELEWIEYFYVPHRDDGRAVPNE